MDHVDILLIVHTGFTWFRTWFNGMHSRNVVLNKDYSHFNFVRLYPTPTNQYSVNNHECTHSVYNETRFHSPRCF
jgi:hypothetical protein